MDTVRTVAVEKLSGTPLPNDAAVPYPTISTKKVYKITIFYVVFDRCLRLDAIPVTAQAQ